MANLRNVWVDVAGDWHLHGTIQGLINRDLAEEYKFREVRRVRLTNPVGKGVACYLLSRAADMLVEAQNRDTEQRAERLMEVRHA